MNYASIIIPFVGGLGMFIYGMQIMAQGLENAAGSRMKSLLEALTKNKLFGVMLGAFITAVIQSSSATTVMVVGVCKRRYHESVSGDGRHHGSKYRNDGNGLARVECGMGEVFKSCQSRADCDYYRCDHHADGQETFIKKIFPALS